MRGRKGDKERKEHEVVGRRKRYVMIRQNWRETRRKGSICSSLLSGSFGFMCNVKFDKKKKTNPT